MAKKTLTKNAAPKTGAKTRAGATTSKGELNGSSAAPASAPPTPQASALADPWSANIGDSVQYRVFDVSNPLAAGVHVGKLAIRATEPRGEFTILSKEDEFTNRPASVKVWPIVQLVTGPNAPEADLHGFAPADLSSPAEKGRALVDRYHERFSGAAPAAATQTAPPPPEDLDAQAFSNTIAVGLRYKYPPTSQVADDVLPSIFGPAAKRVGLVDRMYCFRVPDTAKATAAITASVYGDYFELPFVELDAAQQAAVGPLPVLAPLKK